MRQMQEGIVKIDGCWVDDFARGEREKERKKKREKGKKSLTPFIKLGLLLVI